jgi:hypothetical protein
MRIESTGIQADLQLRLVTRKADAGGLAKQGAERGSEDLPTKKLDSVPTRAHNDVNANGIHDSHDTVLVRLGVPDTGRPEASVRKEGERRYREAAEEETGKKPPTFTQSNKSIPTAASQTAPRPAVLDTHDAQPEPQQHNAGDEGKKDQPSDSHESNQNSAHSPQDEAD